MGVPCCAAALFLTRVCLCRYDFHNTGEGREERQFHHSHFQQNRR
jgi:hypothetical protein